MARTSRRHSYRKSRRWNPDTSFQDKDALDLMKMRSLKVDHLMDLEAYIDLGKLSSGVAKKAKAYLDSIEEAPENASHGRDYQFKKSASRGKSKRRSTKSRKGRKSKARKSTKRRSTKGRKSTRRSTKSRRSTKRVARKGKSSRSTWVAKQKRQEKWARRKARWYQSKHKMKKARGGNSKSQLNRALYHARGGRFASKNPRRRSARRSYRRW